MATYLHPTREAGRALLQRGLDGAVDMLNLLRFREIADYTASPALAPASPISGREAYRAYAAHALPLIAERGGELRFDAKAGPWLIGPDAERWDRILIVRHRDVATFMSFASDERYRAIEGHRTAALEDSRLLPMIAR